MQQATNENRVGGWFLTYTGKQFWPLSPRVEDVDIIDIAHALSNACRFGGHCRSFYSVAQHSVHVSRLVPSHLALAGLMHDATEAYIGDMVRPLKYEIPQYLAIEENLWRVISLRYDLPFVLHPEVKKADDVALMTERRDLINSGGPAWSVRAEPDERPIHAVDPKDAEIYFLYRFRELTSALSRA